VNPSGPYPWRDMPRSRSVVDCTGLGVFVATGRGLRTGPWRGEAVGVSHIKLVGGLDRLYPIHYPVGNTEGGKLG
jgi:hypothetical protein